MYGSRCCAAVLALAFVLLPTGHAQNATGSVNGTVTDPNGAVVPSANITITNKATGGARKITTNSEGSFWAENLQPGDYEVRVEHSGFSGIL